MNQITFQIVSTDEWFGKAIDIAIDGENLIDLIRQFEEPMAANEGHPEIAGGYMGLPSVSHRPPSDHFFGGSKATKSDLLWCGDCGEPGCWPLRAEIAVDRSRVVWTDFEQPHRDGRRNTDKWNYDGFGPFIFDRTQYESALNNPTKPPNS